MADLIRAALEQLVDESVLPELLRVCSYEVIVKARPPRWGRQPTPPANKNTSRKSFHGDQS